MLEVNNVTKSFGGLKAVNGCSFVVPKGSIVGLIGPNGSGKTTLFNLVTGFLRPDEGEIRFKGNLISGHEPFSIAETGIRRTFQLVRLFRTMTVMENMLLGGGRLPGENLLLALLNTRGVVKQEIGLEEKAINLLTTLGLKDLADEYVSTLGYGELKLLEFARALMSGPELILLDEPTAGVNSSFIARILEHIRRTRNQQGITYVVVEHNMRVVMKLCERIVVLNQGLKIAEGTPKEVSANPLVIEAYLGG